MLTQTDLFGHPVVLPQSVTGHTPVRRRVSDEVQPETKRKKLLRKIEQSGNLVLFDALFQMLKSPLVHALAVPQGYASDIADCAVVDHDDEDSFDLNIAIPYAAWGKPVVEDKWGNKWSEDGLLFTQIRLFWRSFEELALNNNEQEKWSVLKWIFRPAIWKHYVYDQRRGKSHCLEVHERDDPFSFHNCCLAVRMEEELLRDGVSRNIPVEVLNAVRAVSKFD